MWGVPTVSGWRRGAGALCEGSELRPGDRRHHSRRPSEGGEAAVHAWDDILAPYELSIAYNTLGDEFRVLDEVGRRVNHAGDNAFPVRQFHLLEDGPFVLVTGVGALKGDGRGACLEHWLNDLP